MEKETEVTIPQIMERSTSCTRETVEVATQTTPTRITEESNCSGSCGVRCHYCMEVRERIGSAEFTALQTRIDSMNKEEWARILEIIVGKAGNRSKNTEMRR